MKLSLAPMRNWLRRHLWRASARLFPRTVHRGIKLHYLVSHDHVRALFFAKARAALDLIEAHDPRRLARIVTDLRRIALVPAGGEYYDATLGAYIMDVSTLEGRTIDQLSLKIVHEATHARLFRAGIDPSRYDRARLERACVSQEVAFAIRLPNGGALAAHAKSKLQSPWWSETVIDDRLALQLGAYGAPSWLVRMGRLLAGVPKGDDAPSEP